MVWCNLTARRILMLLKWKYRTEGIDALAANDICRFLDESLLEVYRGMDELTDSGLILREESNTAELTPAGIEYDLLLDGSVAHEYDRMSPAMKIIMNYFTEREAPSITRDLVITESGLMPGEVEDALDSLDALGYPVHDRVL
jgi:hypothetical protein